MTVNKQCESNKVINYEINIKCDEALKGLKALYREVGKATRAIKELKSVQEGEKDA